MKADELKLKRTTKCIWLKYWRGIVWGMWIVVCGHVQNRNDIEKVWGLFSDNRFCYNIALMITILMLRYKTLYRTFCRRKERSNEENTVERKWVNFVEWSFFLYTIIKIVFLRRFLCNSLPTRKHRCEFFFFHFQFSWVRVQMVWFLVSFSTLSRSGL